MDNSYFKQDNGVKRKIPMYAKVLLSFCIVIVSIVIVIAAWIIYSLIFSHHIEIAKMEKKYNQSLVSNFEKNIDAFELLGNVFIENDTINLTPSEDGYIIRSTESYKEFVKYEEHAIYSNAVTDALHRIMAESDTYPSYNGENEIKCRSIYPEKDAEQNKYVMFIFNRDIGGDGYIYLIYSETGQSWEPNFPYFVKKEIRINENWYLLYARHEWI